MHFPPRDAARLLARRRVQFIKVLKKMLSFLKQQFLCGGVCRNPQKTHHGGFRCGRCGSTGATYSDLGYHPEGDYVHPLRRVFSRRHQEMSRTTSWKDAPGAPKEF